MDPGRIPVMAMNDVGGTGTHNLKHWSYNMRNAGFKDYNGKNYDTSVLKKNLANTDMLLFVGANDALSQPGDVTLMMKVLPQDHLKVVNIADYNHLDYMWASDANTYVNNELYHWLGVPADIQSSNIIQ